MAFQLIREMAGNLGSSFFQVLIAFVRSRRDHVLCAISRNLVERLRKLKRLFVTLVHNGSGVFFPTGPESEAIVHSRHFPVGP